MTEKKSFIKLGVIYAVGQVLSKILSFVFLPIYTKQLGSSGYGQLALADTVLDFIGAFIICGIYSGYNRFYSEYDEEQRKTLKNTAINFALILVVFDILFVVLLGKPVSSIIFKFDNAYEILVLIVIRSITVQFVTLFMCDYTLNYNAVASVTTNLVNLILNLIFSIFFVIYENQGIVGVYKGYIYSNALVLIYLIINYRSYKIELDKNMLKNMFTFSGGLILGNVSGTILTLSDRYFLAGYRSYSETGIYSIGYKFGMLIEPLFISPFRSVFTPYKFQHWKDSDAQEKFNNMFNKYHVLGLFVLLGISIYSKIIISIFATDEFIDAYKIITLILFSYFIYEKSCFYNLGIQIKNKTYLDSFIMLGGGVINIILNIVFIPGFGMYGAAIATCISYIIMNLLYLIFIMPMHYIRYDFKKVFLIYGISIFIYSIYYIISLYNLPLVMEFIEGIALLSGYLILCIIFKLINKESLIKYKGVIAKKFVVGE